MHKESLRLGSIFLSILLLLMLGTYLAYTSIPLEKTIMLSPQGEERSKEEITGEETAPSYPFTDSFINKIVNSEFFVNPYETYQFHNGVHYFLYGFCEGECLPVPNYPDSNFAATIDRSRIAIGDLDGDGREDAAVILSERYGGTKYFVQLAVVRNDGDRPMYVTAKNLGEKVIVESIHIQNGLIFANLRKYDLVLQTDVYQTIVLELIEGTLIEKIN